jgi:hypothetical protein
MKDNVKPIGTVLIERRDNKTGKVLDSEVIKNTVVNTGKERVAKLLNGESSTEFKYIAIGTDSTAVQTSDTALISENTRALGATGYEADYKATVEKTFTFGSAYTITEAGLFDSASASGSVMFDRFTFTGKEVDGDTDLYVKITVTIS